ncbi:MAG: hypothetical protein KatS3mg131_2033 [Candidatus Tectimicrobiota bacterium]|nr:MAG: hypothetical protein KatS3mg131_2033 [Candidatus Tectomicrobia bacterium]
MPRSASSPRGLVLGRALAGVALVVKPRVAAQHHAVVGAVHGQGEGAGAHGKAVQGEVLLDRRSLGVEAVHFPGHGGKEGHGQPVKELRVLLGEDDAKGQLVHHLRPGQVVLAQVEVNGMAALVGFLVVKNACPPAPLGADAGNFRFQALPEGGKALDVSGQQGVNGALEQGMGQALDLVDVVLGAQGARAFARQLVGMLDFGKRRLGRQVPAVAAVGGAGKGGVLLVVNAGLEANLVDHPRHLLCRRFWRQGPALGVKVLRLGHRGGGKRRQGVGALEVVVLQGRLVDLVDEGILVGRVRPRRVEVLGFLAKGVVVNVLPRLAWPVRVVGAGGQEAGQQQGIAQAPCGARFACHCPPSRSLTGGRHGPSLSPAPRGRAAAA